MKIYKKVCLLFCLLCLIFFFQQYNPLFSLLGSRESFITESEATSIAKKDASTANYYLEDYDILILEQKRVWRVIFDLKDPNSNGGGPEYIIDKRTGHILKKTYYQ